MAALQKKICMLGAFSVGKTSLVKRFVQSIFSEAYLTTVGVKIDKKTVELDDRSVTLILWDLAGEDDIASLPHEPAGRERFLRLRRSAHVQAARGNHEPV